MVGVLIHPSVDRRGEAIRALTERMAAIEQQVSQHTVCECETTWPAPLDRISPAVVHEWFGPGAMRSGSWSAPRVLFVRLARTLASQTNHGLVIWIGQSVWPAAQLLARHGSLLNRSLLIDPATDHERLWAIDVCARSRGALVTIADGSALKLSHTRRLQLGAEHSGGFVMLARPRNELSVPSAATMRWGVHRARSPSSRPRWSVELLRCKGVQRMTGKDASSRSLILEHDRATGCLRVPAELVSGSLAPQPAVEKTTVRRTA
ncbi:MAG TPA: hypothetical protein VG711_01130 [Phycisphaerales bacterium]|nr:hypothetical protein [Phycisphaerales bacterium]